jgi:prophage regulatory protein
MKLPGTNEFHEDLLGAAGIGCSLDALPLDATKSAVLPRKAHVEADKDAVPLPPIAGIPNPVLFKGADSDSRKSESLTNAKMASGSGVVRSAKPRKGSNAQLPINERLIRRPEVQAMTGLSRSSLYRLISEGFPKPVRLSRHSVGWVLSEIVGWIALKVAESRRDEAGTSGNEGD